MNLPDIPELVRAAPGALGSLISMLWLKETVWFRRLILWIGGTAFAFGGSPAVAKWTHLEDGFVLGFLLGLGSMAFFSKVFETWQGFALGVLARDVSRKWAGLPPHVSTTKPAPLKD